MLNEWSAANCRVCLAAIDPYSGRVFTARIFHTNKGAAGEVAVIRGAGQVRIGRSFGDVTFPKDKLMSPAHAVFVSDSSGFRIVEAGGLNGVFLRVESHPLRIGDTIMCASEVLRLAGLMRERPDAVEADGTGLLGSPSPEAGSLVLQQVILGGRPGRTWIIKPPVTIGREECDVCFPDVAFVSGRHAVIEENADGLAIKDLGSANGTFVRIRGQAPLSDGDLVLIGQQMLQVSVQA
jgi:pSer/pThr/pTyr-binding forkhead associated (FHA) protein